MHAALVRDALASLPGLDIIEPRTEVNVPALTFGHDAADFVETELCLKSLDSN